MENGTVPQPRPGTLFSVRDWLRRRAAWILHRSEELFQSFNLFVVRFQVHVFFQRRRGSRTFAQFVIDESEIEVDEREPGSICVAAS